MTCVTCVCAPLGPDPATEVVQMELIRPSVCVLVLLLLLEWEKLCTHEYISSCGMLEYKKKPADARPISVQPCFSQHTADKKSPFLFFM